MSKSTNLQKLAVLRIWLADLAVKRPKKKVVVVEEEY
jgi:hypothetical protein